MDERDLRPGLQLSNGQRGQAILEYVVVFLIVVAAVLAIRAGMSEGAGAIFQGALRWIP